MIPVFIIAVDRKVEVKATQPRLKCKIQDIKTNVLFILKRTGPA